MNKYFFFIILFSLISSLGKMQSQELIITKVSEKSDGFAEEEKGCVDFISPSADLIFTEGSGNTIENLGKGTDGKYTYRAVCYVPDGDKRVFHIAQQGGFTQKFDVYVEPGNYFIYSIEQAAPTEKLEIAKEDKLIVIPTTNTAGVTISCKLNSLIIKSKTGEEVSKPKQVSNGLYEYQVYFDVTTPESKACERILMFSLDGEHFENFSVGALGSKEGVAIAVLILQESCYFNHLRLAAAFFQNGSYEEASKNYKEAKRCEDKPGNADGTLNEEIAKMQKCTKYKENAERCFNTAEKLRGQNNRVIDSNTDSVTFYHNMGARFRGEILKMNPNDVYCKEYNKKYSDIKGKIDRLVIGTVVDNMNQTIALPGVSIYAAMNYQEETYSMTLLGKTDENGSFRVMVPPTYDAIYFIHETNSNYKAPFKQQLELGKHYKFLIKLRPKK